MKELVSLGQLFGLCLLFGYVDMVWRAGSPFAALIFARALLSGEMTSLASIIKCIFTIALMFTYRQVPEIGLILFVLFNFFLSREHAYVQNNELVVEFQPYEQEIRKLLMEKDPKLLHKVDSLLRKYKGAELELLNIIKDRYCRDT